MTQTSEQGNQEVGPLKVLLGSRLNWLLAFLPVSWVVRWLNVPEVWLFITSALAIVPLANLISRSTEQIADRVGPRIGGLLNATLGNAPELIIGIFAIRAGLIGVVKASISGSILGNILLVLGMSMLVGGWHRDRVTFDRVRAGQASAMLLLAIVALVMPAVFDLTVFGSLKETGREVEGLSVVVSVVLIATYIASLVFSLTKSWPATDMPSPEYRVTQDGVRTAIVVLASATVLAALESELLVSSIQSATKALGMTEFFVGVIIVALVGNVTEHLAAVTVAAKNKMDLSMAIVTASSIQIALFVAPLLVFVSLLFGHPLSLVFNAFEVTGLTLSVLILAIVSLDGESNWLEGLQLVAIYLVLVVVFYFVPGK